MAPTRSTLTASVVSEGSTSRYLCLLLAVQIIVVGLVVHPVHRVVDQVAVRHRRHRLKMNSSRRKRRLNSMA